MAPEVASVAGLLIRPVALTVASVVGLPTEPVVVPVVSAADLATKPMVVPVVSAAGITTRPMAITVAFWVDQLRLQQQQAQPFLFYLNISEQRRGVKEFAKPGTDHGFW